MFILNYIFNDLFTIHSSPFFSLFSYKVAYFYVLDNYVPTYLLPYFNFVVRSFSLLVDSIVFVILLFYSNLSLLLCFLDDLFSFSSNSLVFKAISIAIKFLFCIAILIFSRGGIPRFRFDYLTKLGWIRFLSLVLVFFLIELFLLSFL